ncbi:NLI interacting factor-like phosphatase family protein [Tritrichomonas foetus]|uniref:Mitochondrial import inner membrane translocase subunit TIM50 n=1 Tax=Tritrichomonas foetus TaxID=1144522 RepID=A0A1J4KKF4_9EUKA|nr:NLI interacting factor-like phosphatase family protein [Tritrichomonas foetus]|eukprot:OHT11408.1 NLI interacting factor-like phosphatase family protein [Tritrichomonas foetus]
MFIGSMGTSGISQILDRKPGVIKSPGKKRWSISNFMHMLSWECVETYTPPPIAEGKKVLVLDMDETLIHSSNIPPHSSISFIKIGNPGFYVYKRPGLDEFLEFVMQNFEVFIFTYGSMEYAEPVLNSLCPKIDKNHRLYRDQCEKGSSGVKKDISIFGRPKTDVILIDDSNSAMNYNPKNTIQISRWMGMPNDSELVDWLPQVLQRCLQAEDVRKVIEEVKKERSMKKKAFRARSMTMY